MQFRNKCLSSTYWKYCLALQFSSPYSRKEVPFFYCIAQGKAYMLFGMWLYRVLHGRVIVSKKNTINKTKVCLCSSLQSKDYYLLEYIYTVLSPSQQMFRIQLLSIFDVNITNRYPNLLKPTGYVTHQRIKH